VKRAVPEAGRDVSADARRRLVAGESATPHDVLGTHAAVVDGTPGVVIRAFHPDAVAAEALRPSGAVPLAPEGDGLFAAFLPGVVLPLDYRLRFRFSDGREWERGDPYRFLPTLGDVDLYLLGEGTHRRLYEKLGAHPRVVDGTAGVAFAVWAPSARRVSVVGEFCGWDGRLLPMRSLGVSGVFELFVPGVEPGMLYKYEVLTRDGHLRVKTDPFAQAMERPPGTASRVVRSDGYGWGDEAWMAARAAHELRREPVAIYEVHLGSWARVPEEGDRSLTFREIAPRLAEHARRCPTDQHFVFDQEDDRTSIAGGVHRTSNAASRRSFRDKLLGCGLRPIRHERRSFAGTRARPGGYTPTQLKFWSAP